MTVDDSAVRAERLMVGLYRMNATLPADGVLVNPPNLVDVVKTLTREAAELPPDRPLPQWLVDRGVGALVRQYVDGSLPHLAKAAARLDAAGCVNSLGSLTDQPTCDRAALPASVPEPAVWTPLWYAGETHALLIGVGLGVEEAADETGASRPLSQALRREANNSVAAAAKVLVAAGLPAVAAPTLQPTTNSLGPLELSTLHAAPAVGLSYIARRLGLASPTELGVVVLGDPSPTGGWSAVSEDLLQALASGTDVDDLIVRTGQGWERRSVGSVVSNSDSSLAGAAALLWGADWDERLTTARQQTLADAGWTWTKIVKGTPLEAPPGSEALPVVESKLATGLHHRFRMAQEYRTPAAVILGGPVATGKSVAAAQVIGRLRDTGWTILSLTTANHDLPAVDDMTAVVRSALLLSGTKPSWRTLVVLQDFYPVGATNIGEVVAGVQIAFHTHVLAIARYETTGDNDWDSGAVEHAASIVGTKALHDLATVLVREHPREYGTGRTDLNPIVRASGGDLRLLCRLLAATADRPADVDLAGLTGDMVDELLDGAPETSEAMRLLASTSLIGTWLSFNGLAPEVVRALLDKGAQRRPEGLVLSSSFLGKLILSRGENDDIHELRPTLVARLAPYLRRMLAVNEDLTVLHLVRSARAHDQELLADLLDSDGVDRDLSHWLQNADLRLAAATLLSLEFVSNRLQVVGLVTKLLANEKHSELSAGELGAILRLINKYRDNLERRPESGEPNAYAAFLERLTESGIGLRSILDRPATLSERVGVANQLARLSRQDMDALLVENTAGFLHGLKPTAEHYRLLRRLDQILERCRQDGAASPGQRVLSSFDDLQELLERRPPADESFDSLATWMAFQVYFGGPSIDREELLARNKDAFLTALSEAGAGEIARGLDEFFVRREVFTWMMNVLLTESPLTVHLTTALRNAQPAEAAALVSAVGRLHGSAIRDALYELHDGQLIAREDVAQRLARRVSDAKGIGMLLTNVHQVDEWFMPGSDGFASRIAEHLGVDAARRLVETDPRPSVLYHFFRALWQSRVSYWAEVERAAFDAVVGSLRSGRSYNRPWAPHLALLIGSDDHLGESFLADLSKEIDEASLLRQMTAPARADALTHMHRLGRALHPTIAERFTTEYVPSRQLKPLLTVPPQALIECLRVTVETIVMGGSLDAGPYLTRKVAMLQRQADASADAKGEPAVDVTWEESFRRRIYRAGDLAQGINSLARLDRVRAVELVHNLDRDEDTGDSSYLLRTILRARRRPTEVSDLLTAVHRISPQLGQRLFRELRESSWAWPVFKSNLQWEQLPLEQCRVAIQMAALGLTPSGENTAWMQGDLLDRRWMKVAPMISSPHVVSSLLKLLCIWKSTWAMQFAKSLDLDRVIRRVQKLGPAEAQRIPALINLFSLIRDDAAVARLTDVVGQADQRLLAARLGLQGGSKLLYQLAGKAPGMVSAFAPAFAEELSAGLRRRIVVDHAQHWRDIGWAAATLRRHGTENLIPDRDPAIAPNPAFAAEVAWASTWLGRPGLVDGAIERSIDELNSRSGSGNDANTIAMLTITAAREGWGESLLNDEVNASQIGYAGLGLLALAHETAARSERLGELLAKLRPLLETRLREPMLAADPFRAELLAAVGPDPGSPRMLA